MLRSLVGSEMCIRDRVKPATILARSSDGNVRVRDVVRIYDVEGEEGISELAWTSPLTKYIIEAYDAC